MRPSKALIHLLTALAAILFWLLTKPYGLGLTPDSVAYLEVAGQIQGGNGIVDASCEVVNHWPPLYPILLAGFGVFFKELAQAGLFLNLLLVIGLGYSFNALLRQFNIYRLLSLAFAAMLVLSGPFTVLRMLWSEGPFLFFTIVGGWLFAKWYCSGTRRYLMMAGLFAGLALLTRYAGAGFVVGYLVLILCLSQKAFRGKLIDLFLFLLPSLVLLTLWLIYSYQGGSPARQLVWHPLSGAELNQLLKTIAEWFAPNLFFKILGATFLGLSLFKFLYRRGKLKTMEAGQRQRLRLEWIPVVLVLSYLFFLVVSKMCFDNYTPLDNRILSPIFPFLLLLLGIFIQVLHTRGIKWASLGLTVFLLVSLPYSSVPQWVDHYREGSAYSARIWQDSETLEHVKEPKVKYIYSNGYDILPLYTRAKVSALPRHTDPVSTLKDDSYQSDVEEMKAQIESGKAVLIYFENINWRWYLMGKEEILETLKTQEIRNFKDGFVIE